MNGEDALISKDAIGKRTRPARLRGDLRCVAGLLALALGGGPTACSDNNGAVDGGSEGGVTDGGGEGNGVTPGVAGRFSALAAQSGTLMLSAYEAGYGDLILVSATTSALTDLKVEFVDGVPSASPTKDPQGYRKGITDAGDDVGQDTDIVLTTGGAPMISYFDVTNSTLKFASRGDSSWTTHTVDSPKTSKAIVGRYTAMTLVGGKPAIVYLALNIPGTTSGTYFSELRFAQAKAAVPASASDWTLSTIESVQMSCRNLCATDEVCVQKSDKSSSCQKKGSGCTATCTSSQACVGGACVTVLATTTYTDVPEASGLWPAIAVASGAPVVVYYNRIAGSLRAAALGGSTWKTATVKGSSTTDVGAFPSVALDSSGVVHVAYQDVGKGALDYLQLDPKTLAASSAEVVDDGSRSDGQHLVGADPVIFVDAAGAIRVFYQDSQTADLLGAKRAGSSSWTPKTTSDSNLGRLVKGGAKAYGFYSDVALDGGKAYGSTFYYDPTVKTTKGGLELFLVQ
jgi:hypothetical protein